MSLSSDEFPIVNEPAGISAMPGGATTRAVAGILVIPAPLPAKTELVMKALVMAMPDTTLLANAALPPFKFVASCHVAAPVDCS